MLPPTHFFGGMWRRLVLASLLAASASAFAPAPIRLARSAKPTSEMYVLAPVLKALPTLPGDAVTLQTLAIREPTAKMMSPGVIPQFTAKADSTITWETKRLCLEAGGATSGYVVRLNHCTGGLRQKWNWLPWGPIQLKGTNQCVDVVDGERGLNGASVVLRECAKEITASWMFEDPLVSGHPQDPPSLLVRLSSLRHVMVFSVGMAIYAFLWAAWWRWQEQPCSSTTPLDMDQGGVALTSPSERVPAVMLMPTSSDPRNGVTSGESMSAAELIADPKRAGVGMRLGEKEAAASAKTGLMAAGALATSLAVVEGVQIGGTAVLLGALQAYLGTENPVQTVAALIEYVQDLGLLGYPVFALVFMFLQIVPIAAAFVLTLSAGAIFGALRGTITVLVLSTLSATISFLIARNFGRDRLLEAAKDSKTLLALDKAFRNASFEKSLFLITLLRLSPVLPFSWANYVFGLSPAPLLAFSLGTVIGITPAVSAYVIAGQAGADAVLNGGDSNPVLLALGGAATLGAISIAGNTATQALKEEGITFDE